jgi:ferredoxin-fold anticodon binding domain-containing protein
MTRRRLITLTLFAVLASTLLVASSAFAEAETRYYIEGIELTSPETLQIAATPYILNSEIAGAKIEMECDDNIVSGTIETEGQQTLGQEMKDCSIVEIKNGKKTAMTQCQVQDQIRRIRRERFAISLRILIFAFWEQEEIDEPFREQVQGVSCTLKGEYEQEGSYRNSLPESGIEKTEHELVHTSTGSEVTFGGKPASVTFVEKIKLASGKKWRAG